MARENEGLFQRGDLPMRDSKSLVDRRALFGLTLLGGWVRTAIAAAFTVMIILLAVFPSQALASTSHAYSGSVGASGSTPADPYPLTQPTDVEVDQATNDIYVTDPGNHRIEKFDSAGHFLLMFGGNVDKTKAEEVGSTASERDVCTAASGDVCQAGILGASSAQFEDPTYLAVDNSAGPSKGDVYVADTGDHAVQKFDSAGHIVSAWGLAGEKTESGSKELPEWGLLYGIAVAESTGALYVGSQFYSDNVFEYSQDGTYIPPYHNTEGIPWLKVDRSGRFYFGEPFAFDPSSEELYQDTGTAINHYNVDCNPRINGPCNPVDTFGAGQLMESQGVSVDGTSGTVYVANRGVNSVAVFVDIRPLAESNATTNVTESSVTLNGHIDPLGRGAITGCYFEYGFSKTYGHVAPCNPDPSATPPGSNFTAPTDVSSVVTGLSPGTKEHYRVVVENVSGSRATGADKLFVSNAHPVVDGLRVEELTATSATIIGEINPSGLQTRYYVEYGPTIEYGEMAPGAPAEPLAASDEDQKVEIQLSGLTPHVVYHYRLVADNSVAGQTEGGVTRVDDHTFNFYPPNCPNENVRQQTQANFLPDCRAYELVSPADAGGTQLFPYGPNTGLATTPSRFAYVGTFSTIPGAGGSPIDGGGDLYIATRTPTGWTTRYVGLASSQAPSDGGPPQGPPDSAPGPVGTGASADLAPGGGGPENQNGVLTDPSMDTFLDFNDGNQAIGSSLGSDFANTTPMASNAPFAWSADGAYLGRWPTNLPTVPSGIHDHLNAAGEETSVNPGGVSALDCSPVTITEDGVFSGSPAYNMCPGDVTASEDLSHFVFASEWNVFASGGTTAAPGSVYDNDTASGTVVVASKASNGENILSEPGDHTGDPLQIPAVSKDGSRILMAAGGTGPCGSARCGVPPCGESFGASLRCPMQPSQLYLRVDGATTVEIAPGHYVHYVGSTSDLSRVYFTTTERLTTDDTDSSRDLYMWSQKGEESGEPLTLVSLGGEGAGNSDSCSEEFSVDCGVVPYSNSSFCTLQGGAGGACRTDNFIAAMNGDIYFFSPEQLDGSRGVPDQENLYDFRNGAVQYVTTFSTGPFCLSQVHAGIGTAACSDTPVVRMQVSPDDSHMAFVTAARVTQYDNAGHLEMYTYEPDSGKVQCVSCLPSGAPPTSDIGASQDGLFMSNDGRTFFSTEDSLVHSDTNNAQDIYEYVEGHPQLITPGTGDTRQVGGAVASILNPPGLVGVSANGIDVYFSTYDTLVREDHNGLFLKFYDARSAGGISAPAPPPPCEAADECHGPGSPAPELPPDGTGAPLGPGGNAGRRSSSKHRDHGKHRKRSQFHVGRSSNRKNGQGSNTRRTSK